MTSTGNISDLRPTDHDAVTTRALTALDLITAAIRNHPGTGQGRRLVAFLAGCYNGQDFPFDLTELRSLDRQLSDACLEYLSYDRLGLKEVHRLWPDGEKEIQQWIADYRLTPQAWESPID